MPPIITLITDFSTRDGYVGTMKGVILGINPRATIVDISHEVPKWDIRAAAFVLHSSYRYFPSGTVHVVIVDPGVGSEREILAVRTDKYVFLAPDNGLLSLVLQKEPGCEIYRVSNRETYLPHVSHTFHGRDVFAPVAAYLTKKVSISEIGERYDSPVRELFPSPQVQPLTIVGSIIYRDEFGNLITNISEDDVKKAEIRDDCVVTIKGHTIRRLQTSYASVPEGELLVVISSAGFLEIACNRCSAAGLLDADVGEKIHVSS